MSNEPIHYAVVFWLALCGGARIILAAFFAVSHWKKTKKLIVILAYQEIEAAFTMKHEGDERRRGTSRSWQYRDRGEAYPEMTWSVCGGHAIKKPKISLRLNILQWFGNKLSGYRANIEAHGVKF